MISIPHSPIEAFAFENAKWSFPLFQFLTVRLKLLAFDVTRESSLISIPHSPIEAAVTRALAASLSHFNSSQSD